MVGMSCPKCYTKGLNFTSVLYCPECGHILDTVKEKNFEKNVIISLRVTREEIEGIINEKSSLIILELLKNRLRKRIIDLYKGEGNG